MGFFDRPKQKIRNKIPAEARESYDLVLIIITSLPDWNSINLDENRSELVLGVLMSVWACNSCAAGDFQLTNYENRYIHNMGVNCHKLLKEHSFVATNLLDFLISKKIIPHSP